jgi:serine/threonine-protein kinase
MSLTPGTKLASYEIVSLLGAGGMGEVYKAKDTRLDRTVAIKVLPSHLSGDAELKRRFEREARAVSSLNHPHICTLHDIGEQDGVEFLVMEYLEGGTLADRLKKGALPTDEALRYAIEIADALDKAHRQGVVHRDLKPGNIMLTKVGAKLLDFGLAKLKAPEPGQDNSVLSALPTKEKPLTEKGSILGTFQYMAPEQLESKEADTRTDIFAFGSVLYEMLTGLKAFEGKSQASLISAIMSSEPRPISEIQPTSPPPLDRLVKRCLEKDPEERWQSAGDLTGELKWIAEGGWETAVAGLAAARPRRRERLAWGVSILVAALVTGIAMWSVTRPGVRQQTRLVITLPETDRLNTGGGVALSADGRDVVYVGVRDGVRQLYRRSLGKLQAVPIQGTEGVTYPFFSPDGEWLGFFADDGKLKKMPLAGGPPVTLCDAGGRRGASWGQDDVIVFAFSEAPGLKKVSASGGATERLTTPENERTSHRWLEILPGGKAVLFTIWSGSIESARIAVLSLETGEQRIFVDGTHPRYAPTGHIVFARVDSLWAVPFDAGRLEVTGTPTPVLEGVRVGRAGLANFALGGDGSLVYVPSRAQDSRLVWVDRKGYATPLTDRRGSYEEPRLSPDGERLAVLIREEGKRDVWIHDIGRDTMSRLTTEGDNEAPVWSPDGEWIAFSSDRGRSGDLDVYRKRADFSGPAETIITKEYRQSAMACSPDGTIFTYVERRPASGYDMWALPLESEHEPWPILKTSFSEASLSYSPDGRWIVYVSNESGRYEVYVQPFPGPGRRIQISTDGGTFPAWSPTGRDIFYLNGQTVMAVEVETEPGFRAGTPRLLFQGSHEVQILRSYDVTPDGQRFVMIQPGEQTAPTQLNVILNWLDELKRLAPTR